MESTNRPKQRPLLETIYRDTFQVIQEEFKLIAIVSMGFATLSLGIELLMFASFKENFPEFYKLSQGIESDSVQTFESFFGLYTFVISMVAKGYFFTLILSIPAQTALCLIAVNSLENSQWDWQYILNETLKRLPAVFITALLYYIGVTLSTLLCVLPGLVFAAYFGFSIPSATLEKTWGFSALKRSHEVVGGKWVEVLFFDWVFMISIQLTYGLAIQLAAIPMAFVSYPLNSILPHIIMGFSTSCLFLLFVIYFHHRRQRTYSSFGKKS